MGKRPPRPRDPMQLDKLIGDIAMGQSENVKPTAPNEVRRKGGLKGGKARAKKLPAKTRREIVKKASLKRWATSR